ncbi:MAG TPA: hypothetical protein VGO21_05765 [Candidatus Paceibacterota bacterium]|jgi:hypothetical protein|nr:hypothetical protein [Candidatus Paceibacterota bacterium]
MPKDSLTPNSGSPEATDTKQEAHVSSYVYLDRIRAQGAPDNPVEILKALKIYHSDRYQSGTLEYQCAEEITKLLIIKLKSVRLAEENIPDEYKRHWSVFHAVLETAPNREEGLRNLYEALREYRENNDYQFQEITGGVGTVISGSNFDKFLSLTLFLDVVLGHAAYARDMGVVRDLAAPEEGGFIIPDNLLGDDMTAEWHETHKPFKFSMLPGSGILLAVPVNRERRIYALARETDGKYKLKNRIGYELLYLTQGGLPMVARGFGYATKKSGVLDPATGEINYDYKPDFTDQTGRLLGPGDKYIPAEKVERRFLDGGKTQLLLDSKKSK